MQQRLTAFLPAIRRRPLSPALVLLRRQLATSSSPPTVRPATPFDVAKARLTLLIKQARAVSNAQITHLSQLAGQINTATGYDTIDRLRLDVMAKESRLLEARSRAAESKAAFADAASARANSQKEVNDLLQRKSSWSSADVMRFTELVQQDHGNDKAEGEAKRAMDKAEEDVDRGFSELMQGILERYHEEQVWSDKIRSLSTYGTLAITGLNVLLFLITILLVEPWKRKRLVEGVEVRLRDNLVAGQSETLAALTAIHARLDAPPPSPDPLPTAPILQPPLPIEPVPVDSTPIAPPEPPRERRLIVGNVELEREQERWAIGSAGAVAGIVATLLFGAWVK